MVPDHLLQIATDLAEINTRRPRRTDLCRALSTVYYALFHCLARTCADSMAGRAAWLAIVRCGGGCTGLWSTGRPRRDARMCRLGFPTRYRSSG